MYDKEQIQTSRGAKISGPVPYQDARRIIKALARQQNRHGDIAEVVPLHDAVRRIASCDVLSPFDTPTFDSSAMDGYAVKSLDTMHASAEFPVILKVQGCIMAGDLPLELRPDGTEDFASCVEIMTGAPFPAQCDACIPFEQTLPVVDDLVSRDASYIQVFHPVVPNQHKRFAGSDYRKGDTIVKRGSSIDSRCCMAAASVGITTLSVVRKVRVGIISTGSELRSGTENCSRMDACTIPDVNGPYLTAALQDFGAEVSFLGSVSDNMSAMIQCIREIRMQPFDIIISSGAVSAGKLDLVPQVIARLNGNVHFHHVAMRPGHPVLFATLPEQSTTGRKEGVKEVCGSAAEATGMNDDQGSEVPFFGLPGNPIAAAASLRFLVIPYILELSVAAQKDHVKARVVSTLHKTQLLSTEPRRLLSNTRQSDQFRHGRLSFEHNGAWVELSAEQSPAKVRPFAEANCWVHVPADVVALHEGDVVQTYLL